MIMSRTPFRISFFGGGTDYPAWYEEHGGAVLSTTIDKYCFVTVRYLPPFFEYKYRIRYTKREEVKSISEIEHPSVRECLNFLNADEHFDSGVEVVHSSDLPAGIGLGSSSTFTVGLLNALYALKGKKATKEELYCGALHVEQNLIQESVGSQDQVAAAMGGFNRISFTDKHIRVAPICLGDAKTELLRNHLMLFFTGFTRTASDVAKEQIKKTPELKPELSRMLEMVDEAIVVLEADDAHITDFGKLLHETWLLKRSLTDKISTPLIDKIYDRALKAGALGGKILGAGGGGCILFFVDPDLQENVRNKLGLLQVPFVFENTGSQIIYWNDFSV